MVANKERTFAGLHENAQDARRSLDDLCLRKFLSDGAPGLPPRVAEYIAVAVYDTAGCVANSGSIARRTGKT